MGNTAAALLPVCKFSTGVSSDGTAVADCCQRCLSSQPVNSAATLHAIQSSIPSAAAAINHTLRLLTFAELRSLAESCCHYRCCLIRADWTARETCSEIVDSSLDRNSA